MASIIKRKNSFFISVSCGYDQNGQEPNARPAAVLPRYAAPLPGRAKPIPPVTRRRVAW